MERSPYGQLGEILHPVFVSQFVPLFVFESVKPRLLCIYERLRLRGGWCFTGRGSQAGESWPTRSLTGGAGVFSYFFPNFY